MTTKGVEGKKSRYPQQHVRPGRGVAGYTGNVEVYATKVPRSFEGDGGTATLAKADKDYASMKNEDLRSMLDARGLDSDGNKADLIARLKDDDSA